MIKNIRDSLVAGMVVIQGLDTIWEYVLKAAHWVIP